MFLSGSKRVLAVLSILKGLKRKIFLILKTIDRYENEGIVDFYISKSMEKYFTNFISNHLVSKLEKTHQKEQKKLTLIGESYHLAIQEIRRIGLTTATTQLTESIINAMIETVEKNPKLNTFFTKIVNSTSGFMYQHAHMCSALTTSCVKETNLPKDDKKHFFYHCFCLFLSKYLFNRK